MNTLVERVIEQIKGDLFNGDLESLEELLSFIPRENLIGYLPEEEWVNFNNEFVYEGYMSSKAQEFFRGNYITEQRDGCATVGSFIKLENGKIHLPSKGDIFTKSETGITVKSIYR